ncbi:hypothetical protein B0H14DRAFT_2636716 [Mycena olivaceomarginata]|nr:hypothetical protein B0H14DRAFT_2636716 [Mycena olivaceomarginata]
MNTFVYGSICCGVIPVSNPIITLFFSRITHENGAFKPSGIGDVARFVPPAARSREAEKSNINSQTHLLWLSTPLPGMKQGQINAELRTRIAALEADNTSLRAESVEQGCTLAAVQAAIARLEITSAPPLVLRTNAAQGASASLLRHSSSPTPHYPQNFQPSRPRSRSPLPAANTKHARLDDLNGFVAFGPVNDSAEPPQKLWELYLRTAIPGFRLEAPYAAYQDPNYPSHLRVTVKSRAAARALVDAWGKQTVAGYAGVRMVEMAAVHGTDITRNGPAQPQSANRGDANFRQHARTPGGGRPRNSEPERR